MSLLIFICLAVTQPLFCSAWFFQTERCFSEMLPEYQCYSLLPPYTNAWFTFPESPSTQEITFKLFTERNPTTPQILGARDESSVQDSNYVKDGKVPSMVIRVRAHFPPKYTGYTHVTCSIEKEPYPFRDYRGLCTSLLVPVAFITHGFSDSTDSLWITDLTKELLTKVPNVIAVDWARGARPMNYYRAVANSRVVGAQIATLIKTIRVAPGKVHLIGHSLGAQVSGYAGEKFTSEKIGRITGLDPAGPTFMDRDIRVRLDPSDAAFVDVIHTDAEPVSYGGLGIVQRCGHVDFYPNRGHGMPGCSSFALTLSNLKKLENVPMDCSHSRAYRYFNASINANVFKAYPCASVEDFDNCTSCGSGCNHMGYGATSSSEGLFVLKTEPHFPY